MMSSCITSHRTTVFEMNSAVYFARQRSAGNEPPTITGYRALWNDRGKLAVAKHASDMKPSSTLPEFVRILLREGASGEDDTFIEAHIYGPMTRRTFARMTLTRTPNHEAFAMQLRQLLSGVGVPVEEV